jgi:hypothetical protein
MPRPGRVFLASALWLCALMLAALAGPALANDGRARLALVIGNAQHTTLAELKTTRNDAQDMAVALEGLGFEVLRVYDADAAQIRTELEKFTRLLKTERYMNALAVFYFAGYGLQRGGKNYILPVGFDKDRDRQKLEDNAVRVDTRILTPMTQGRAALAGRGPQNVVILDASREDPFGDRPGLAQMDVPKGTLVAFSAKAGEKVTDTFNPRAPERNSIYAKQLLRELDRPNPATDLLTLFKTVRDKVFATTNKEQEPLVTSDFDGLEIASMAPATTTLLASADETRLWGEIATSRDLCDFEAYRDRFPAGAYLSNAQVLIEQLKKVAAARLLLIEEAEGAEREAELRKLRERQQQSAARCAARWKKGVTAAATPSRARPQPVRLQAQDRTAAMSMVRPVAFFSREPAEAERIYKATVVNAEQGDVDAMYRLALMHETGYGPAARDETQMLRWLALASKLGNGPASYKLYRYYAEQATGYTRSVRFRKLALEQRYFGPVGLSSRR